MGKTKRLRELFDACVQLPLSQRDDFIARSHPELREQLRELILADASDSAKDEPVFSAEFAEDVVNTHQDPLIGQRIGHYKLANRIGEGGMGSVYLAEQEKPIQRSVALKIIKLGMDTESVIARFEAERQALAIMDHPNIAMVFDAGATDTGRPYFVMELVKEGIPITDFCDKETVSLRDRLSLFMNVCRAVQHAHQKGIIHRDLKPNNILVTLHDGKPVPKVIDFGIAKATEQKLNEGTTFTKFGQLMGTPAYMSPEQAGLCGLDIDTRSDIYSLGVLLYELLTGATPFDVKTVPEKESAEILRIVREVEPPMPSTRLSSLKENLRSVAARRRTEPARLTKLVRGDLDWIVMKCLEKDRSRRYETANGLATDIQRHLSGEPVHAAPPSATYRAKKFVRKHRGNVAASLAIVILLITGTIVSYGLNRRAEAQKTIAEQNEQEAKRQQAIARVSAREKTEALKKEKTQRKHAEEQKSLADRRLYNMVIPKAKEFFDAGMARECRAQLDAAPLEHRGWEWHWLDTHLDGAEQVLVHPVGEWVVGARFSALGDQVVTWSILDDGEHLRIWDTAAGLVLGELQSPNGVHDASFSPNGLELAVATDWNAIRRAPEVDVWSWDRASRTFALRFSIGPLESTATSISFDPLAHRILTANLEGKPRLWSSIDGALLESIDFADVPYWIPTDLKYCNWARFSFDGQQIVTTWTSGTISIFKPDSLAVVAIDRVGYPVKDAVLHADSATPVSISMSMFSEDALLNGGSPCPHVLAGHKRTIKSAEFSNDGSALVTASEDGSAQIWDTESGKALVRLRGHVGPVYSARFSQDGGSVVTASVDGTARIWNVTRAQPFLEVKPQRTDKHIKEDREYDAVMVSLGREPRSDAELALAWEPPSQIVAVGLSRDGSCVAATYKEGLLSTSQIWVWDLRSPTPLQPTVLYGREDIYVSDSYSLDMLGRQLLAVYSDGVVELWNVETEDSMVFAEDVFVSRFSSDGTKVLSLSKYGVLSSCDVEDPNHCEITHDYSERFKNATAVAMEGPNLLISTQYGKTVVAWASGQVLRVWEQGDWAHDLTSSAFEKAQRSTSVSLDGTRILTTAVGAIRAMVWGGGGRSPIASIVTDGALIRYASLSPDGRRVVTVHSDGSIWLWSAEDGVELISLSGDGTPAHMVFFSQDGSRIIAAFKSGAVRIWDNRHPSLTR